MTLIHEQWREGTPERAVADAFSAFQRRDHEFTDMIRCVIVGHVLESRLLDANPDGRGLISLECHIAGTEDEWLSVQCDPRAGREIVDRDPGVAHVAFHVAWDLPGRGVVPFPPELQTATVQLIDGEWKLVLDEWSDVGLPGFRGIGFWANERAATEAGTDESSDV